jgi:polysaccharide biosynthesis protein PslH
VKILFICHRLPFPLDSGSKIRSFQIVEHFARRHSVTVASLAGSAEEARAGVGLADFCEKQLVERVHEPLRTMRMLARVATASASSMGYFYSPCLARRIRAEIRSTRYDLIFVHSSSMAPYVADVRSIPKVLDFCDMDSQKWRAFARHKPFPLSIGYALEGRKLWRAEGQLARKFDLCTCITEHERTVLDRLGTARRTSWFPNGVDTERFQPTDEPHDPDTVCFVGHMDYYPNEQCMIDFCTGAFPLIRRRRPATRLVIVGAAPSRRVRALGRAPGVVVTGSVADIRPFVSKAALTVAPLKIAGGTQNKILESMAMGVPVVCSNLAARGVDAVPNDHLLTGDTPEDIASAVLRILEDPAERRRLAISGRCRVKTHHSWPGAMRRLDAILSDHLWLRTPPARGQPGFRS